MTSTRSNVLYLALGLVLGLLLANLLAGTGALAQPANQPERGKEPMITRTAPMPHYAISAYGTSNASGCYIIDTTTGETWHADTYSERTKKVVEKLAP